MVDERRDAADGETDEIIRVLRIVEYVGPRDLVERQVTRSIHGTREVGSIRITAVTLGEYPERLTRESIKTVRGGEHSNPSSKTEGNDAPH